VPGAGHLVNVWAPEAFTSVVTRFLSGEPIPR
jgi:pimeloyl-ACP methyl ester carboxylesterase